MDHTAQFQVGGDVYPCRFVTVQTSSEFTVVQSTGSTSLPVGITIESQYGPPTPANTDTRAAYVRADGQPMSVGVWQVGAICNLQAGSGGGFTAGQLLTSDGQGCGTVASAGNFAGALSLQAANANEQVAVMVLAPGTKA